MRFYTIISIVLFLSWSVQAVTTIKGIIVNATHDSSTVTNTPVQLQQLSRGDNAPALIAETLTNSQGKFHFTFNETDTSFTLFASTDFQGVRYFSPRIIPKEGQTVSSTMVVYDTTQLIPEVEAIMHHIIIDDLGESLQFRETRIMHNPQLKTILHSLKDEFVSDALFRFHIPASALYFTPLSAGEDELIKQNHYVYDRGIFIPGNKTISYAYEIPMLQNEVSVSLNAFSKTRSFDVFVSSPNLLIKSDQLVDLGAFNIRGINYHRYSLEDGVDPGSVAITIVRLKSPSEDQSPYLTIILTTALLLLGLSYTFLRNGRSKARDIKQGSNQLLNRKKRLAQQIAQLDRSPKNKNTYEKRRKLVAELKSVEDQIRTHGKKSIKIR